MAGKNAEHPTTGQLSNDTTNRLTADDFDFHNPPTRELVTITPFSVNMFQQASNLNNDPSLRMTMRVVVHIRPESLWASLERYRNFNMREQLYSVHQCAIISRFQTLPKSEHPLDPDTHVPCTARILEIRALNPQNVYVRVYWLYRPEEIPGGRQPYHGRRELIASNHMEIVDALRCIKPVDVLHWLDDVESEVPKAGMYWRQSYNTMTGEISPPKTHCICHDPINPDDVNIHCTAPDCRFILHAHCIIDSAWTKLESSYGIEKSQRGSRPTAPQPSTPKKLPTNTHYGFHVELTDSTRRDQQGRKKLLFTDNASNRFWQQDIECLKCGKTVS